MKGAVRSISMHSHNSPIAHACSPATDWRMKDSSYALVSMGTSWTCWSVFPNKFSSIAR